MRVEGVSVQEAVSVPCGEGYQSYCSNMSARALNCFCEASVMQATYWDGTFHHHANASAASFFGMGLEQISPVLALTIIHVVFERTTTMYGTDQSFSGGGVGRFQMYHSTAAYIPMAQMTTSQTGGGGGLSQINRASSRCGRDREPHRRSRQQT